MKTILPFCALLMLTSTANAGSWFKVERPCGSKCPQAETVSQPPAPGSVRFRDHSPPNYESRTVITSPFGTSVYRYRSYSR